MYNIGRQCNQRRDATSEDVVNLYGMTLEDIGGVEVNNSAVTLNFKDGGSLTINGDTSGLTYKIG